jgi:PBP1b-binding outer membrane lipoprotein LpoB
MNIRLLALFSVLLIWGCSEDGNEAPPPEVNFTTQQAAISADNE